MSENSTKKVWVYGAEQVRIDLKYKDNLSQALVDTLNLPKESLVRVSLLRVALDSRKKNRLVWSCNAEFAFSKEIRHKTLRLKQNPASAEATKKPPKAKLSDNSALLPLQERFRDGSVHIVGAGPAGLWAALHLLKNGIHCVLHEQGRPIEDRYKDIRHFLKQGAFDPHSNLLYGEGGAGAFSDGKLTCRTRNTYTRQVLQDFAAAGAGEEVTWQARPHVGTDRLQFIVRKVRNWILELGGDIRFGSRLEDLEISDGAIRRIFVNGQWIHCDALILAAGHSARDMYKLLAQKGVQLEAKAFAVGVRAEHSQDLINVRQYGSRVDFKLSGAAEYTLSAPDWDDVPGAWSFCMCPGGVLVPCASEAGHVATNGMSYSKRNAPFANSGLVVPVDLSSQGLWKGIELQQKLEKEAFLRGGENYGAPAQTIRAFLDNRRDANLPRSSFPRPLTEDNLHEWFPKEILQSLMHSLENFERKIPGFLDGLLVAPETRTSSPVRIQRDPLTLESVNVKGLFPLGEGAGYAGGIVSSAGDGVRLAEQVSASALHSEEKHKEFVDGGAVSGEKPNNGR